MKSKFVSLLVVVLFGVVFIGSFSLIPFVTATNESLVPALQPVATVSSAVSCCTIVDPEEHEAVGIVTTDSRVCTGTLITDNLVLTAAHCACPNLNTLNDNCAHTADFFLVNVFTTDSPSVRTNIKFPGIVRVYPDFRTTRDGTLVEDIAVVILNNRVSDDVPDVTPIPLEASGIRPAVNEWVTLIGYGGIGPNCEIPANFNSPVKLELRLPVAESTSYVIGFNSEGKHICKGDSGAPILNAAGHVVGVASFGDLSATSNYIPIAAYYYWIFDIFESDQRLRSSGPAITRDSGHMEMFWERPDGSISSRWYDESDGGWKYEWELTDTNTVAADSQIATVTRDPGHMEIFFTQPHGGIAGRRWEAGGWQGQDAYNFTSAGASTLGSGIATISRSNNDMEVFWVTPDGRIAEKRWYGDGGGRHDEIPLTDYRTVATNSSLATVTRDPGHMEIFWERPDGGISGKRWEADNGGWQRDYSLTDAGTVATNSPLATVTRDPGHMEIFWERPDGGISGIWYGESAGGWQRDYSLTDAGTVATNSPLATVTRDPGHMEIFWERPDGGISGKWYGESAGGWQRDYSLTDAGTVATNSPLATVTRNPGHMEIFWERPDGRISGKWWEGSWQDAYDLSIPGAHTQIWSASFGDQGGWNSDPAYYSTIQFPDVNGDGEADVCGRSSGGIECAVPK